MTTSLRRFGLQVVLIVIAILLVPLPVLAWYDGIHYWGDNDGMLIVSRTGPYTVGDCQLVSDGDGGAFFVFLDILDLNPSTFSAALRAQRRDHEGTLVLSSCLVRVPPVVLENDYQNFATVSDGFGGVIVAWVGESQGKTKMLAQRINADGTRPWGNLGIVLSSDLGTTSIQPLVCPDKMGGAFVGWGSRLVQVMEDGSVSPGVDGIEFIPGT